MLPRLASYLFNILYKVVYKMALAKNSEFIKIDFLALIIKV